MPRACWGSKSLARHCSRSIDASVLVVDRPSGYVLDSFALLAYLEGGAGMSKVRAALEGAAAARHHVYMSLINLGEVLYVVERERG